MHRHHRTSVSGQARIPVSAVLQRLLSSPSNLERARREEKTVSAGDGSGSPPRIDPHPGRDGNHGAARNVEPTPKTVWRGHSCPRACSTEIKRKGTGFLAHVLNPIRTCYPFSLIHSFVRIRDRTRFRTSGAHDGFRSPRTAYFHSCHHPCRRFMHAYVSMSGNAPG